MVRPPVWQPPSLEEFLADIESRLSQPVLYQCNGVMSATKFLAETGHEENPAELVEAAYPTVRTTIDNAGWRDLPLMGLQSGAPGEQWLALAHDCSVTRMCYERCVHGRA